MSADPVDLSKITRVYLGDLCPECSEGNRLVYARSSDGGHRVFKSHNKCGWGEYIDQDWQSYLEEAIRNGYILHPKSDDTLIGSWDIKPWMVESSGIGVGWTIFKGFVVVGYVLLFGVLGAIGGCTVGMATDSKLTDPGFLLGAILGLWLGIRKVTR